MKFVIRKSGMADPSAWITQQTFYRFITSLTAIYQSLSSDKLYHVENGTTYLDKKKAIEVSRRISLYRNALTITPTAISAGDGTTIRGIELLVDNDSLGALSHLETLSLLEQFEHFDTTTFTMLAGVVDELEMMQSKLDRIEMKTDQILELLKAAPPKVEPIQELLPAPDPFNWQTLGL